MPDRLYVAAATNKPSALDHALAHAFAVGNAAGSIAAGLLLLLTVGSRWDPSYPVAQLPEWGQGSVGLFQIIGGACILAGLLWRGRMDTEWFLERAGLYATASSWGAYAAAALAFRPDSTVSAILPLGTVLGCALRLFAIHRIERRTVEAIARARAVS